MKKEITADKALIKYNQINNVLMFIAIIVLIVVTLVTIFITFNYFSSEIIAGIIFFLAFSVYAVLFGVFIFVLSPTFHLWKFWAFSRVGNVHELKERLILLGHVSEENKFFEKIENSTKYDQKYWNIRLKFAQENIFVDDKTIPDETLIYYSKKISIIIISLMMPLFAFGILLLIITDDVKEFMNVIFGFFFMISTAIIGYFFGYKKLINKEPQLILDNKGIYSNKKGFYKWEEIESCIIWTGNKAVLLFTHSRGHENIKIQELNVKNNGIRLSKLLMVYKERNKLQKNQTTNRQINK